jgi:hypothetical protein
MSKQFFFVDERVRSLMLHTEGVVKTVHFRGELGCEYFIVWDNGMSGSFTEQQIVANGIKKCLR